MLGNGQSQAWIGLAVFLCLMEGVSSKVFMGRYNGKTRRDFMFDQIVQQHYPLYQAAGSDPPENVCAGLNKNITLGSIEQKLDNFDPNNTKTWRQHYQENDQFFNASADSHVVFMMIGGESKIENKWVCFENYTYMQLAKKNGALVVQPQHRFFGNNEGLNDLTLESLKYLNTQQALADLYSFIKQYNEVKKLKAPRWVAFGGSYPGTMAALFRKYYENATVGAISSSSVFGPKLDLWEYAVKMELVLNETDADVPGCYDAVRTGFQTLQDRMLTEQGRGNNIEDLSLSSDLNNNGAPNQDDILTVQFQIFDAFQGIFQYTYDGRQFETQAGQTLTVNNLCKIMTASTNDSPVKKLGNVYRLAHNVSVDTKIDPSYDNYIKDWKNTSIVDNDMRGWLWLQCDQIGYLQSTTNQGVFGNAVPITYLLKQCTDIFGAQLTATLMQTNVNAALKYFGQPWEYNATNVVVAVSGYDPWSMLASNVSEPSKHQFVQRTEKVGHCGDMYPFYNGEPEGLKATRDVIEREVVYYLTQKSSWPSVATGTDTPATTPKFSAGQGASLFIVLSALFLLLNN